MRPPIERLIDAACGLDSPPTPALSVEARMRVTRTADALAFDVLHYIDTMYPAMWQGVPKTARISVRRIIVAEVLKALPQLLEDCAATDR